MSLLAPKFGVANVDATQLVVPLFECCGYLLQTDDCVLSGGTAGAASLPQLKIVTDKKSFEQQWSLLSPAEEKPVVDFKKSAVIFASQTTTSGTPVLERKAFHYHTAEKSLNIALERYAPLLSVEKNLGRAWYIAVIDAAYVNDNARLHVTPSDKAATYA